MNDYKSTNIQKINEEARKQMEPGDSLYGWSLISYDDGTLDLGSQGYVRDPKSLESRSDFLVTGRVTKDSRYIQNGAAFEEGAVFSDNDPWRIEDLEDGLEEAGEIAKIREIYPEFRPEQYDGTMMYPMIPKECITSADTVLDDPEYAEQYCLFQIPSDPDTNGNSYIQGGIVIPVNELHEDPKTGDYLMVEDESRSFNRVSFDRDGNLMPNEGPDATIRDIHMYTHGYQSDQYYDNLKNALGSEKEDTKSYEKQEEQSSMKKIDDDRYDVSDIIRVAADKAVGDAGKIDYSGYYDDSGTGLAKNTDKVKYLDEKIDAKDLGKKSTYEHIKIPAGLVKGPFNGKNNQQFDVVSVPLSEDKWGTMSVAEKQLNRGKTENSPVVMALPADRERNVKVKGEDGKTSVEKVSPSDLHQMFDKNWQHLAERNKSAEYVSEDVKTAEASDDRQIDGE